MSNWKVATFTVFSGIFLVSLLLTAQLAYCITDNLTRKSGSLLVRECIAWMQIVDKPASQLLVITCCLLVVTGVALLVCGFKTVGLPFRLSGPSTQRYHARHMTVNQDVGIRSPRSSSEGRGRATRRMTTSAWSSEHVNM